MKTIEQKVEAGGMSSDVSTYIQHIVSKALSDNDQALLTFADILEDVVELHQAEMDFYKDYPFSNFDHSNNQYAFNHEEIKPFVLKALIKLGEEGLVDCGLNRDGKEIWTMSDYFHDYLGCESKRRISEIAQRNKVQTVIAKIAPNFKKLIPGPQWPFPTTP